ncbi:interferon regulatory factor 2-like isoform X2 [Gigantopelta aegis]|uniref:interferon regulatory factor 2-like isoform X2 n=1 Tax=Gigantopelta aegis TaxID=1735272 RepID=UPI001B88BE54|nr:interferon regulatory factor 2-like isoform X2 [Gigantopelta aegis]
MVARKHGRKQTVKMPRRSKKEIADSTMVVNRRPIRPIDRQRMRPWLVNLLNEISVPGLSWEDQQKEIFDVSWRHGARHGWDITHDADVFCRWALHTGKFKTGDPPNPKLWKANFRCALNSLPDVKRLPSETKGQNALRRYQFLDPSQAKPKGRRSGMKKKIKREEPEYTDSSDTSDTDSFGSQSQSPLPRFNLLFGESHSQSLKNHNSGFRVTVGLQPQMETSILDTPYHVPRSSSPESAESFTGSEESESELSDQEVKEIVDQWERNPQLLDNSFSPDWCFPETEIECAAMEEVKTSDSSSLYPEGCQDLMELNAMAQSHYS